MQVAGAPSPSWIDADEFFGLLDGDLERGGGLPPSVGVWMGARRWGFPASVMEEGGDGWKEKCY